MGGGHFGQRAGLNGRDDGAGGGDAEALTQAVAAAGPARVHEIDAGTEGIDALHQQVCIDARGAREEHCPEAGRERRRIRLGGIDHGGAHLCRVAGEEVIGRGLFGQDRHRRQHTAHVASEEDDGTRLAAPVRRRLGADVVARITGAGVLREGRIRVVRLTGVVVDDDVLHDGAERDGVVDHRLRLAGEVDALGVAAAFQVEHRPRRPTMLVVADQKPLRVRGQRRLAGARQAEEQRHIALGAHVGGAMHGQHIPRRQQVVLHREERLLHFAGVAHPGDEHTPLGEVNHHRAIAQGAVAGGVAEEVRRVQHFPDRLVRRIEGFRHDEQRAPEQGMPRVLGAHLNGEVMLSVRPDMQVRHEHLGAGQVPLHPLPKRIEDTGANGLVDGPPVDVGRRTRLFDDEPILRRAPGAPAGLHDDGAGGREPPLAALHRQFGERRGAEVVVSR